MCKRGGVNVDRYRSGNSERPIDSYGDIEPPAFDLGISPSHKQVIASVNNSIVGVIQEIVRPTLAKRDPKLSFKLRSPYVTRVVMFDVTSDESEPVFMTPNEKTLTHQTMQSLATQSVVCKEVLDGWATVLNREERLRSNESPRRYFIPTDMDHIIRDQGLDVHQRYESFKKNVTSCTNNDKELISMRNIDLVFFPIVETSFFYIVVFNLKRPSIVIIDSENQDGIVDDIYGSSTVVLQDMMIMHLLREGHDAWKVYAEMNQDQIKTRWQSRENSVDCGVMLMRHMETYFIRRARNRSIWLRMWLTSVLLLAFLDFTTKQSGITPANGWKSCYEATRAFVMGPLSLNEERVKCIRASGDIFTG
ncbi:hypothetical protein Ccrd_018472 [Cynara cardunculus var. scolymus]|uniref:Peptidase C48, SUMO/Sentrin/Ubl1 n=1 Tax=Cynara cardunculus var. scolymus TaxID=59895 RepID=A0A103Y665_CYNCS|nr:hypothetical protein Ccrd_018472 [Cynara cardunculus var. scolymus]